MTFSPLPRDQVSKVHFVPQAVVDQPPGFFAERGVKFHEEHDDLDEFSVAEMMLDDKLPFALLRYRGNPPGQTTLFLPNHPSLSQLQDAVLLILKEFGLGASSLVWRRERSDTPY
jgi:hypothetical protein